MFNRLVSSIMLLILAIPLALAEPPAPWGPGKSHEINYAPNKVVYDVSVKSVAALESALDRTSYLSLLYNADPFDASIVLVLHGDEINYFSIKNYDKYRELMARAQSLTVGGVIQIRMCKIAAKAHGYEPEDIHGFVEIVPMADAEIVRLQRDESYAYMR